MKKSFNFIFVLMIFVTMFSGYFVSNNHNIVKAEEKTPIKTINNGKNKYLNIYQGGKIELGYDKGFTEILIFIEKCKEESEDGTSCDSYYDKEGYVYHVSGKYTGEAGVETIHLYKSSYVSVGDFVRISFIYNFLDKSPTTMLYCNVDAGLDANMCKRTEGQTKREKSVVGRIEYFDRYADTDDSYDLNGNLIEKKGYIVKGTDYDRLGIVYSSSTSSSTDINFKTQTFRTKLQIDNTEFEDAEGNVEDISQGILTVCLICMGLAYGVTAVVIGVKIVKSADQPQERMEAVKKLRNITIGLVIAFLVVWAMPIIVEYVEKLL